MERDRFVDLTYTEFMKEFRAAYLEKDWEEITRIELLAMTQGDSSFWDFAIQVQAKNSLLRDTASHLSKHDLRQRIESGMTQKLALRCRLERCNEATGLEKWLIEVKRVDDLLRIERAEFESLAKATRDAGRRNNAFAEPSRRANVAPASSSLSSSTCISLPKLTPIERKLIYDNEGCLKCHCVFVNHQSGTCPNDFPDAATYKPLTQAAIDTLSKHAKKSIAAVTDATMTTSAQPIAVVMGVSAHPVAYMPSNISNVIEGDSTDSEPSVSNPHIAAVHPQKPSPTLTVSRCDVAPLTVPHLFWQCSISGPANCLPVTVNALIDHGAHAVLISEDLATSLNLRRRKLHDPMAVEMAMPGEGKNRIIELKEWVKLAPYDVSGLWTSKTVCAVIAPLLCARIILGLPFLLHNNIIIDHTARTVIDKLTNFDLLNPPPPPTPKVRKRNLKEFFLDLKADRELMLAELKMVVHDRLLFTQHHFEPVKPVDPLAALRLRIEALTTLTQLNRLSDAVRDKYSDVFDQIPHLDELPTDVYCRIRLKDVTKTITTRSYSTP